MQAHEIDYQIFGEEMQYVEIELDPQEIVVAEAGSFMMMDNGIKMETEGLKTSGEIIHTQIKAYIARNILDNKGFYPIWENIDTTLKYAIDFLKK